MIIIKWRQFGRQVIKNKIESRKSKAPIQVMLPANTSISPKTNQFRRGRNETFLWYGNKQLHMRITHTHTHTCRLALLTRS